MTPDPREDDIFSVPLSGGDLSKVRAATGFSFAVAAGRLYFTEVDGTTALLRSTLLDGTDLVTHFTGALPLTSLHAAAGQLIWTAWDAQYRMPLGGGPVETIGSLMGVQRMASDARGTVAVQWSCRETQDDSPPECTNTMYALPGQRALASYRVSGNEAFGESIWEIVLTDRDAYWVIGATELYRVRR
jgi:hypothetical protein